MNIQQCRNITMLLLPAMCPCVVSVRELVLVSVFTVSNKNSSQKSTACVVVSVMAFIN